MKTIDGKTRMKLLAKKDEMKRLLDVVLTASKQLKELNSRSFYDLLGSRFSYESMAYDKVEESMFDKLYNISGIQKLRECNSYNSTVGTTLDAYLKERFNALEYGKFDDFVIYKFNKFINRNKEKLLAEYVNYFAREFYAKENPNKYGYSFDFRPIKKKDRCRTGIQCNASEFIQKFITMLDSFSGNVTTYELNPLYSKCCNYEIWECDYFTVDFHKNGKGSFTFQEDVLAFINQLFTKYKTTC